jgi:ATP-dependent Clp protease ATP-binding subunit ClpC
VRQRIAEVIGAGEQAPSGPIAFTPQSKKLLELALPESRALRHRYIGAGHIRPRIIRQGDGGAAQVPTGLGGLDGAREQVIRILEHPT